MAADASQEASEGLVPPRAVEAATAMTLFAPSTSVCASRSRAGAAVDHEDEAGDDNASDEEFEEVQAPDEAWRAMTGKITVLEVDCVWWWTTLSLTSISSAEAWNWSSSDTSMFTNASESWEFWGGRGVWQEWFIWEERLNRLWKAVRPIMRLSRVRPIMRLSMVRAIMGLSMRRSTMWWVVRRGEATDWERVVWSSPVGWAWVWVCVISFSVFVVTTSMVAMRMVAMLSLAVMAMPSVPSMNLLEDLASCTANLMMNSLEDALQAIAVSDPGLTVEGAMLSDGLPFLGNQILELLEL